MTTYEIIKSLCQDKGIAVTALEKEIGFGRGSIGKLRNGSTSGERLQKIADYFGVTVDYLMTGDENSKHDNASVKLNSKDQKDIAQRLEETLSDLENSQSALMFSGEPLDDETRELLRASLENSLRIGKINAKQKFTPKKYQK